MIEMPEVTRFELIDQYGRVFVIRGLSVVGLDTQDGGKTLKLFCVSSEPQHDD